jgi:hypothetical protein
MNLFKTKSLFISNVRPSSNFLKISKKLYFSYPCPRKLREIVKITLFEREQPDKIKEIWQQYYEEKPHAFGLDINSDNMQLIVKKYSFFTLVRKLTLFSFFL